MATIESVGSSTRIEGGKLTDAQVESLLSTIAIRSFKTRDEQEVAGYAETVDLVFEALGDMRLTENHVRPLHQTLLRHSEKMSATVAFTRLSPTLSSLSTPTVGRSASSSRQRRCWTPPNIEAVRELMPALFELLEQEAEASVRVVLGHFMFVYIHPYMDGDGRMGRFMMNLMLASGGYPWTIVPLERRGGYMAALVTRQCGAASQSGVIGCNRAKIPVA